MARLWAVVVCALFGSYAAAVLVPSRNVTARASPPDGLETSQTRVNQVDGPPLSGGHRAGSADQASGKDYDGGYPGHNTYGPPREYYYDERPSEHFRPPYVGHHPPGESVYQQYSPTEHQYYPPHHGSSAGGGEVHHRPGELNIQPLLLPLAGITLLGVLSALVKTPLLLHLGNVGLHRRRRDVTEDDRGITAEAIKSLVDKFVDRQQRRTNLQSCLVCDLVASTYNRKSSCAERSVCEVMSRKGSDEIEPDKRLLTAMIAQILENEQIPEEFRKRLESAEAYGRNAANCTKLYPCNKGEDLSERK